MVTIRPYAFDDFDAVTRLWRAARELTFPDFQRDKGHTFLDDCDYFRNVILQNDDVWMAEADGRVAGFLALAGDLVDQLFIHPEFQCRGVGRDLLDHAKHLSPEHLFLYTFQINITGRAFYKKNGFVAVRFGVSPAPESEPDVEYHWRPSISPSCLHCAAHLPWRAVPGGTRERRVLPQSKDGFQVQVLFRGLALRLRCAALTSSR